MQLITGRTRLLGVIGYPIEHTLSPAMHNAAIAHLGLDYVYLPFPIHPQDLARAIAGFEAIGVVGFNITIPHKQAILPLLSQVSPAARAIGAVNSVWRTEAGWNGTNTDLEGFIAPLQGMSQDWSRATSTILGNGGATRAVVAGCVELGCRQIRVVGRNREKLERFQRSWENTPFANAVSVHLWEELPDLVSQTDLLVNATPVGMAPESDRSPLSAAALDSVRAGTIAYDLIYTPSPTLFLQQMQQRGAIAIDGSEMLVGQGAAALRIWLQCPVPVDVMRRSLQAQLAS